jgi:hypothetical protein
MTPGPFGPQGGEARQTMIWRRSEKDPRVWERRLVRRMYDETKYVSELIYVPAETPVCLACLSVHVMLDEEAYDGEGELHCLDCGIQFRIIDL